MGDFLPCLPMKKHEKIQHVDIVSPLFKDSSALNVHAGMIKITVVLSS